MPTRAAMPSGSLQAVGGAIPQADIGPSPACRTYWISNQVGLGGYDNAVTAIAEGADVYIRTNKKVGETVDTTFPDGKLVDIFEQLLPGIDVAKNNFVVFHLMGNHEYYCSRYPAGFNKFSSASDHFYSGVSDQFGGLGEDDRTERIRQLDCYDNSIAYTDSILQKIFEEAQRVSSFRSLVYLSDHADDALAGLGHNSDQFTFEMTHIPLVVWLAGKVSQTQAKRVRALQKRAYGGHLDQ